MKILLTILLGTILFSCYKLDDDYSCQVEPLTANLSRIELLQVFDATIQEKLALIETPNPDGSLGRNKSAYFHVRFQMGLTAQADYAVGKQNSVALENAIKAIEQNASNHIQLISSKSLENENFSHYDLMLISNENWKSLIDTKDSWVSELPSCLILNA